MNTNIECLTFVGYGPGCAECPILVNGFCGRMVDVLNKIRVGKSLRDLPPEDIQGIISDTIAAILKRADHFEEESEHHFEKDVRSIFRHKRADYFRTKYTKGDFSYFFEDEFKPPLDIEKLCTAIIGDNYNVSLNVPLDTLDGLNELLEISNFYEIVYAKKPDISLKDITKLIDNTKPYRNTAFTCLKTKEQKNIVRLNRILLETIYPQDTPKCHDTRITQESIHGIPGDNIEDKKSLSELKEVESKVEAEIVVEKLITILETLGDNDYARFIIDFIKGRRNEGILNKEMAAKWNMTENNFNKHLGRCYEKILKLEIIKKTFKDYIDTDILKLPLNHIFEKGKVFKRDDLNKRWIIITKLNAKSITVILKDTCIPENVTIEQGVVLNNLTLTRKTTSDLYVELSNI